MHDSHRTRFVRLVASIRPFSISRLLRYTSRYELSKLAGQILGLMDDGGFCGSVHKRRVRCIEEMFLLLNWVFRPLVRIGCIFNRGSQWAAEGINQDDSYSRET